VTTGARIDVADPLARGMTPTFDRKALAAAASDARGRGDRKEALARYREILQSAPDDFEVHGKLAQLLAESGDLAAASMSFHAGAEGYHKRGFTDRAIALLKQAVEHNRSDVDAWLRIAELTVVRKRLKEAAKILADARAVFRKNKRGSLASAARILDAALTLERDRVDLAIDRARVAKKMGQRSYGILLLTDLCARVDVRTRKRLRRALFGLRKTPASFWRWLTNAPAAS
jgi:tetratricopeptide (TPR) repeat protein